MGIREAIFTRLVTHSGVAAIVGTRVYPLRLEGPVPAVVYQRISTPRVRSHSGPSGLANPRFQLTCWAEDPDTAALLAQEVRLAFDGLKGTVAEVSIGKAFAENEFETHDPDRQLFRSIVDVRFGHQEVIA